MNKITLSYIAGFYEGEGGCYVFTKVNHYNGKRYEYPFGGFTVQISQKYRPIISWIEKTVGFGSVRMRPAGGRFGSTGIWYWTCSSRQGTQFLKTILPYMRCPHKIKQARRAIYLYENYTKAKV